MQKIVQNIECRRSSTEERQKIYLTIESNFWGQRGLTFLDFSRVPDVTSSLIVRGDPLGDHCAVSFICLHTAGRTLSRSSAENSPPGSPHAHLSALHPRTPHGRPRTFLFQFLFRRSRGGADRGTPRDVGGGGGGEGVAEKSAAVTTSEVDRERGREQARGRGRE